MFIDARKIEALAVGVNDISKDSKSFSKKKYLPCLFKFYRLSIGLSQYIQLINMLAESSKFVIQNPENYPGPNKNQSKT